MHHSLVSSSGVVDGSTSDQSEYPTLIILLAGDPVPSVASKYGSYHDIFCQLFHNAFKSQSSTSTPSSGLRVTSFDAVAEEYPTESDLNSAKGLLVTGSASSAYEQVPWIMCLTYFCAQLPESHPHLKLFGICFGHQIFASALGSVVEKNPLGWEIGVRGVMLTDVGKRLMDINHNGTIVRISCLSFLPIDWSDLHPMISRQNLHQLHQDHVISVPPSCFSIGSTLSCPIHGLVRYTPDVEHNASDELANISLLTVQGHPEFNPDVTLRVIDERERMGVFDEELAEESREYAQMHDDGIRFGGLILRIMGI
ncbi:class I glutamine amidotransferase-like protein [Melampsora americana]|nr:class I glutamine amidotransferase-like protein [Melampsora americana]